MKSIEAGEFEVKCLEWLDEVEATREPVVVTKSGKAVAQPVPMSLPAELVGALKGRVLYEGDIISPLDVEWDAAKNEDGF